MWSVVIVVSRAAQLGRSWWVRCRHWWGRWRRRPQPSSMVRMDRFGFAVGLWPALAGCGCWANVVGAAGECPDRGDVGGAVVGHHPLDSHAARVEGTRSSSAQEADRGWWHARLRAPRRRPARVASSTQTWTRLVANPLRASALCVARAWYRLWHDRHLSMRASLLDVDVHRASPWLLPLIAVGRLDRMQPAELLNSIRLSTACTVDNGMPSIELISASVSRTRRNAAIAATRSGGVRPGTRHGRDDRSSRPATPSHRTATPTSTGFYADERT